MFRYVGHDRILRQLLKTAIAPNDPDGPLLMLTRFAGNRRRSARYRVVGDFPPMTRAGPVVGGELRLIDS
jgi:hypothetical protein